MQQGLGLCFCSDYSLVRCSLEKGAKLKEDKSDALAPLKVRGLSESTMTVLPSFVTTLALATMSSARTSIIVPSTTVAIMVFEKMNCSRRGNQAVQHLGGY